MNVSDSVKLEPEHRSAIQALADETRCPADDVNRRCIETFVRLNADANAKGFLVLLTSRRVRDTLRRARHTDCKAQRGRLASDARPAGDGVNPGQGRQTCTKRAPNGIAAPALLAPAARTAFIKLSVYSIYKY